MALHIARPEIDEPTVELIGVRLDRERPRYTDLVAELSALRAAVSAKDAHIASLESQVWAWRSQASNEGRARKTEHEAAWERECELIRVIHQQALALQQTAADLDEPRRRWWRSA